MWLFAIFFTTFFTTALSALGADPQPGIIGHDHKPRESKPPVRLALYQPDIPQNAAALMRLGACLGVAVELIEPCGFVFGERRFRRAGMDYLEAVELTRHSSWDAFEAWRCGAGRHGENGEGQGEKENSTAGPAHHRRRYLLLRFYLSAR